MKYIILTASIFYLLGLKFTSNIDLNAKFQTDSTKTKQEVLKVKPATIKAKSATDLLTVPKDSVKAGGSSAGGTELLAPYCNPNPVLH